MSERSIEVRDPDPEEPQTGSATPSPYGNLLIPLVVVPFLVVGVLVLVFVFFGAVAGQDASLGDNLQRVVHGGKNERKQAAMSLSAQAVDNARARAEGQAEPWPAGPSFAADLERAWADLEPDEYPLRLAVAQLAALQGDASAIDKLATFLTLPDEQDRDGQLRFAALVSLSWIDDPRCARLVVPFLTHSDALLRQTAAGVLQRMPGPESVEALALLLDDPSLELRGQAAISLSHLGDARGAPVLIELVDRASYDAAHTAEPRKYASQKLVQTSRFKAVEALARLDREEDRALLERLARADEDVLVREAAMRALDGR